MLFEISWVEKQKILRRAIVKAKNEDDAINKIINDNNDIIFNKILDMYESWDQENFTVQELS